MYTWKYKKDILAAAARRWDELAEKKFKTNAELDEIDEIKALLHDTKVDTVVKKWQGYGKEERKKLYSNIDSAPQAKYVPVKKAEAPKKPKAAKKPARARSPSPPPPPPPLPEIPPPPPDDHPDAPPKIHKPAVRKRIAPILAPKPKPIGKKWGADESFVNSINGLKSISNDSLSRDRAHLNPTPAKRGGKRGYVQFTSRRGQVKFDADKIVGSASFHPY